MVEVPAVWGCWVLAGPNRNVALDPEWWVYLMAMYAIVSSLALKPHLSVTPPSYFADELRQMQSDFHVDMIVMSMLFISHRSLKGQDLTVVVATVVAPPCPFDG